MTGSQWYFIRDGKTEGPVSIEILSAMAKALALTPNDLVLLEGSAHWVPAASVSGLFTLAVAAIAPPASLPEPAPMPTSVPTARAETHRTITHQWYIARQGQKHGPYPFEQLQQWGKSGMLLPTDKVREKGTRTWQAAGSVQGLFAVTVAAIPVAAVVPPPAGGASPNMKRRIAFGLALGGCIAVVVLAGVFALVKNITRPTDQVVQVGQPAPKASSTEGTTPKGTGKSAGPIFDTKRGGDEPKDFPKDSPKELPRPTPPLQQPNWASRSSGTLTHRSGGVEGRNVQITRDGKYLVVLRDNLVQTYDLSSGRQAFKIDSESGYSASQTLAASPDGRLLAWQSGEKIKLWNQQTNTLDRELDGFAQPTIPSFSPDGKFLAIWARGRLKLWNVATWKQLYELNKVEFNSEIVAFSPDSKKLAFGTRTSATKYGTVLWDIEMQKVDQTISQRHAVGFSLDGKMLLTKDFETGHLHLNDAVSGTESLTLKPEKNGPLQKGDSAISPNGQYIAALRNGQSTHDFYLWRTSDGKLLDKVSIRKTSDGFGGFYHFVFSPDEFLVALVGTVAKEKLPVCVLYDIASGKMAGLDGHKETVTWAGFGPDSKRLVTVGSNGELRTWESGSGKDGSFAFGDSAAIKKLLLPTADQSPQEMTPDKLLAMIEVGMTIDQVNAILGKYKLNDAIRPTDNGTGTIIYGKLDETWRITVFFQNGKVARKFR
jgi:WD40 repeat protein